MRPVFEDGLVDRLGLAEGGGVISGKARVEDLVMAAFNHMDGVDLHIAQVLHRRASRGRPVAKRRGFVEPLGAQPDASGVRFGERANQVELLRFACLSATRAAAAASFWSLPQGGPADLPSVARYVSR